MIALFSIAPELEVMYLEDLFALSERDLDLDLLRSLPFLSLSYYSFNSRSLLLSSRSYSLFQSLNLNFS